jgi:hypothetical protein
LCFNTCLLQFQISNLSFISWPSLLSPVSFILNPVPRLPVSLVSRLLPPVSCFLSLPHNPVLYTLIFACHLWITHGLPLRYNTITKSPLTDLSFKPSVRRKHKKKTKYKCLNTAMQQKIR